ncbi:MAG: hypothetical protein ACREOO_10940 [bacterium]
MELGQWQQLIKSFIFFPPQILSIFLPSVIVTGTMTSNMMNSLRANESPLGGDRFTIFGLFAASQIPWTICMIEENVVN